MPCFNDELNVDDLDSGLLANHSVSELPVISAAALTVRMLPHPAYPLEVEIKTMHHLVGILTSAIDHEMKHHYTKVSSHVDHAFISQKIWTPLSQLGMKISGPVGMLGSQSFHLDTYPRA